MREVRDRFDGLCCQVPGCKVVIRALTGLQELQKLRAHLRRAHLADKGFMDTLETRAEWENRPRKGSSDE